MSMQQAIWIFINTILVIIGYCSIFNFIAMLRQEVTISTTICSIAFIASFMICMFLQEPAYSTKYITQVYKDEEGIEQKTEIVNANYPGEVKQKISKVIYCILPTGQSASISSGNKEMINDVLVYAITDIIVINLIGTVLFKRKELK